MLSVLGELPGLALRPAIYRFGVFVLVAAGLVFFHLHGAQLAFDVLVLLLLLLRLPGLLLLVLLLVLLLILLLLLLVLLLLLLVVVLASAVIILEFIE